MSYTALIAGGLIVLFFLTRWARAHVSLQLKVRVNPSHMAPGGKESWKASKQDLESIKVEGVAAAPLNIEMPFEAEVKLDDALNLALEVPIHMTLTERELDLSQLAVPIDTEIFIDDTIAVDLILPIETQAQTLLGVTVPVKIEVPVHTRVPLKQKVRVRDTIKVPVKQLQIPVHIDIPVQLKVPIRDMLHARGTVRVSILDQTLSATVDEMSVGFQHVSLKLKT